MSVRFTDETIRRQPIGQLPLRFPDCTPEIDGKISGKPNESRLITAHPRSCLHEVRACTPSVYTVDPRPVLVFVSTDFSLFIVDFVSLSLLLSLSLSPFLPSCVCLSAVRGRTQTWRIIRGRAIDFATIGETSISRNRGTVRISFIKLLLRHVENNVCSPQRFPLKV